jgi:hypothetical protein
MLTWIEHRAFSLADAGTPGTVAQPTTEEAVVVDVGPIPALAHRSEVLDAQDRKSLNTML